MLKLYRVFSRNNELQLEYEVKAERIQDVCDIISELLNVKHNDIKFIQTGIHISKLDYYAYIKVNNYMLEIEYVDTIWDNGI